MKFVSALFFSVLEVLLTVVAAFLVIGAMLLTCSAFDVSLNTSYVLCAVGLYFVAVGVWERMR
ncbi:hypothetical protein LNAOJCKE_0385 [Methylorubrum aminovorans]|uniref:Uncharacterized protein n=1 Tax=Methylorubrum aminovorans TaxID=269069 RepID=A0ABQ4U7A0_9HYPH|nr:hypothetical protein [Methylorubrum aminovorans]GJE63191.1 hypothetical protein LNAOJCKE_0385 [Methylorubrum aminovorans]